MWKALVVVAVSGQVAAADPKPGSCEAVAKQHAKATKLALYKAPADCALQGGDRAPHAITSDGAARPFVTCKDPKAKLGVDWKKQQLIVTSRSASPAEVGIDVYDDGKVVTFVSRQRPSCKDDPRPMPGPNTTFVYQLTAGTRTFAEGSCNVERTCPK